MPISNFLLIVWFLLPYLALLVFSVDINGIDFSELQWAFKNTIIQALGTGFLTLVLGYVMALGLGRLKRFKVFEMLLMLPSLTPSLIIILLFLHLVQPFPFGHLGVILIQSFVYIGITALSIRKVIDTKLPNLATVAYVMGSSKIRFHRMAVPVIFRDLLNIFVSIVFACFAGLTIPLIAGGGQGTTIEVLIFEKFRLESQLSGAVAIGWLQFLVLLVLGSLVQKNAVVPDINNIKSSETNPLMDSKVGLVLVLGFLAFFYLGTSVSMANGLSKIVDDQSTISVSEIFSTALPTVGITLSVGLITVFMGLLVGYIYVSPLLNWFFSSYIAPSTALLGLGGFVITEKLELNPVFAYTVLLSLISFPVLYRFTLQTKINHLRLQRRMAFILGADEQLIFKRILFPQIIHPSLYCGFVASLWALGDFALGKIMTAQNITIAMIIENLMNSYRTDSAFGLAAILFIYAGFLFLVYRGVTDVFSKKAIY